MQPVPVASEDPLSRVNNTLLRAIKPTSVTDDLETYLQSMERTLEICEVPKERRIDFLRTNMTGKYAMSLETVDAVDSTYSQVKGKAACCSWTNCCQSREEVKQTERKEIEKRSGIELCQYGEGLLR